MSEDILRTVKNLLRTGKGDAKRLREIVETIKQGNPVLMSDYRYLQSLVSDDSESVYEKQSTVVKPTKKDKSLELLRIRLAEGKISIDEFRVLKKALTED